MSNDAILNDLHDRLFDPESKRLQNWINDLVVKNKRLYDTKIDLFVFRGEFYRRKGDVVMVASPSQAKPILHESLHGEMEQYLLDKQKIEDDQRIVRQALFLLGKSCAGPPELRNALPECLVTGHPVLGRLPRSRPEAYTIEGKDREMRLYRKAYPRILQYAAGRFLF